MDTLKIRHGDDSVLLGELTDELGEPVDLTGATAITWVRKRGQDSVSLSTTPRSPLTSGLVDIFGAGDLPEGTYSLVVKINRAGEGQKTAPTEGDWCLIVGPNLGTNS